MKANSYYNDFIPQSSKEYACLINCVRNLTCGGRCCLRCACTMFIKDKYGRYEFGLQINNVVQLSSFVDGNVVCMHLN